METPIYSNTRVSTPGSEEALVWTSSAVQSAGEPNCLGLSCWLWLVWCDPISDANSVQMWPDVSWCDNVTWSEYSKHQDGLTDARDSMVPSVLFMAPAMLQHASAVNWGQKQTARWCPKSRTSIDRVSKGSSSCQPWFRDCRFVWKTCCRLNTVYGAWFHDKFDSIWLVLMSVVLSAKFFMVL